MEYAQVLMDNPTGQTPDGRTFVLVDGLTWQNVPWLPPSQCGHEEQMCRECVDTWGIDYEICLPTIRYVITI